MDSHMGAASALGGEEEREGELGPPTPARSGRGKQSSNGEETSEPRMARQRPVRVRRQRLVRGPWLAAPRSVCPSSSSSSAEPGIIIMCFLRAWGEEDAPVAAFLLS